MSGTNDTRPGARAARVLGLLIAAVLGINLGGCASKGSGGSGAGGSGFTGAGGNGGAHANYLVPAVPNSQLDIVFMIDNSPSMAPLQAKFIAAIPSFMNVLETTSYGAGSATGLPDVHIGVVSSDTGPGKFDLPNLHCRFGGDTGLFQAAPRGTCTASPFKTPSDHFLSASANQTITNYTGDIADALGCIAALGDQGCDFEGQLKSVRWAIDPLNTPSDNQGFLRLDAALAVILLTNEDDCSVPDDSDLFDPATNGPYGPNKSFRCNEFGHLCTVGGTLAPPPKTGAVSSLANCVANDTTTGKLTKLSDEITFLQSLKTAPNRVFVAAITGPPTPYDLAPDAAGDQSVEHSCAQSSTEYADPAVRLQQWVQGFGDHGMLETICAANFAPALTTAAAAVAKMLAPLCLPATLVDSDPNTSALDPDCQVEDMYVNAENHSVITPMPSCASNANTPPCWQLVPDATLCGGPGLFPVIHRDPTTQIPNGLSTFFSCAECVAGRVTKGCP